MTLSKKLMPPWEATSATSVGRTVLLRLTLKRRKLPHPSFDPMSELTICPRVTGSEANHCFWGYCGSRTYRTFAWYGTNQHGTFLRICNTTPKIRLRRPHTGSEEVLQDGYRLVLLCHVGRSLHYYGIKNSIHELDQIRSMPFLCQSLFGHEDTPPFWCQREWRAAANFAITCNKPPSPCWRPPEWQAVPLVKNTEAIGPNEVLALPSNIGDGAILPARSAQPTAPRSAKVELQDTAVPSSTEVLHVHSTGLNGSFPRDLPAEQSAAIVHLRGAYGPSLSQMYADQGNKPASEADLPRAPLRSHAEYLEFCGWAQVLA